MAPVYILPRPEGSPEYACFTLPSHAGCTPLLPLPSHHLNAILAARSPRPAHRPPLPPIMNVTYALKPMPHPSLPGGQEADLPAAHVRGARPERQVPAQDQPTGRLQCTAGGGIGGSSVQ